MGVFKKHQSVTKKMTGSELRRVKHENNTLE